MLCLDCHHRGYNAAYGEAYRVSDDGDHREECDSESCKACEVVAEITELAVRGLSVWMTDAEAEIFMNILIRVNERQLADKSE